MKKTILILFVFTTIFSCTNTNKEETIKTLKLVDSEIPNELKDIDFDISILPLETNEDCLLSSIRKIEVTKDYIYILNGNEFHIFHSDGSFYKKIKKGRGPGEISYPMGFSINESYNEFVIIERGNILHFFDLDAQYQKTLTLKTSINNLIRLDQNKLLFNSGMPFKYESNITQMYNDKADSTIKKYLPTDNWVLKNFPLITYENFQQIDNEIFYYASNSRTLYKYDNNDFVPETILDFGKFGLDATFVAKFEKFKMLKQQAFENGYITHLYNCHRTDDLLILGILHDDYRCGIHFNNDKEQKLYLTNFSDLFDLPDTPSFKSYQDAQDNKLYFTYSNDIFLEDESGADSLLLKVKNKQTYIHQDANPMLITLEIK
jgi:hypothetical protein